MAIHRHLAQVQSAAGRLHYTDVGLVGQLSSPAKPVKEEQKEAPTPKTQRRLESSEDVDIDDGGGSGDDDETQLESEDEPPPKRMKPAAKPVAPRPSKGLLLQPEGRASKTKEAAKAKEKEAAKAAKEKEAAKAAKEKEAARAAKEKARKRSRSRSQTPKQGCIWEGVLYFSS